MHASSDAGGNKFKAFTRCCGNPDLEVEIEIVEQSKEKEAGQKHLRVMFIFI